MEFEMIVSQLSIAPVGEGTSLSKYVKLVIETLKKENLKVVTNAMATVIETEDLETLFSAVQKAHNAVIDSGAERVLTELKIDDRRDKNITIESKLRAVQ
jgi:uncharacterized protein (TIGR00106 family)